MMNYDYKNQMPCPAYEGKEGEKNCYCRMYRKHLACQEGKLVFNRTIDDYVCMTLGLARGFLERKLAEMGR